MTASSRRPILAGAIVAVLALTLLGLDLWRSYDRSLQEAGRATRNLTVALEAHTRHTIQSVDLALSALAARPENPVSGKGGSASSQQALMQARLASMPQAVWITLFDRSGKPVVSTDPALVAGPVDVADRDYFRAMQDSALRNDVFIAAPTRGRASGRWQLVMSRRVRDVHGGFAGVIAAAVDSGFFPILYRNIDIGPNGNITLFHENGVIIARSPAHDEFAGRSVATGVLFREHLPKSDSGTARIKTVLQDGEILYSYSRVQGAPLVINVAFDMNDVLADWRQALVVYAVLGMSIVLLVAFAVAMILRGRRRAGSGREEVEAGLRTLFEHASEGFLLGEVGTGRIRSSNPAMRRLLGYTESELLSLRASDIRRVGEYSAIAGQVAALLRDGDSGTLSAVPTLKKDGGVILTDMSVFRVRIGGKHYVASLFRDVTAMRKAQDALRASEDRLNEAQRIARVGNWELDLISGQLNWSEEIFRLFEIDRAKFGATYEAFLNAIHPEDRAAVDAAYSGSLVTRKPYEITHRLLMADGRVIFVHERCESEFDAAGKPLRSIGTVQDISELHQANSALAESHRLLSAIVDTAPVRIFWKDRESRYLGCNAAFATDAGETHPRHVVGKTDFELAWLDQAEAYRADDRLVMASGAPKLFYEEPQATPKGGERWLRASKVPLLDVNNGILGVLGIYEDITERKRADVELQELNVNLEKRVQERTVKLEEANKELETFSYSVAHDLKAPLRGIDGYSRLLLADHAAQLDEEGRGFLGNIVRATRHMGQLLDDLLAYSRLERRDLEMADVDLGALVKSLLEECAEEIRARGVKVSLAEDCVPVRADREGLAMALRNLIGNALKFTRDVGEPAIEIGGRVEGGRCVISVRDNGVGFDMKFHDRIFDMFQRLQRSEDYEGTGVGLAMVKKAMERMGGRAGAESEPGKGATFYLEIPK